MSRRPQVDANKAAANQNTLKQLVKLEGNKSCADCKKNKHPRWASWNLGIFVCIRCSGIHRGMGTHISRVKSVDLDAWTDEQLQSMIRWGNTRANKYWESKLAVGHVPAEGKIENFIRTKYESKRWVAEGPMPDPATLDADGEDTPLSVVQEKAKLDRASSLRTTASAVAPAARRTDNVDLFSDDSGPPVRPNTAEPAPSARLPPIRAPAAPTQRPQPPQQQQSKPAPKQGESLLGLDFFGGTQSAPPARPSSATNSIGGSSQRTDLKQSILSLYASVPKATPASQAPPPQASAGRNPQQASNGFEDAFSSLNFGAPQAAPAQASIMSKPTAFAGMSSPSIRQTNTTSPPILSGGGFFDQKPTAPPQTSSASIAPKSSTTPGGFGDFGDFTSATPSAPAPRVAPQTTSTMDDLFDFSGPTTSPPPSKAATVPAPQKPVQNEPVASKPASSNPPPINMSSYTSSSAFNLSTPAAAPQPSAQRAAPVANFAAMSDPWGSDNAWSTPSSSQPAPNLSSASSVPLARPKAPATTALNDDFGGWASSSNDTVPAGPATTAAAPFSAVSAVSDGFGAWGSNDAASLPPVSARPTVTQDDDFGGWSSASPVAAPVAQPSFPQQPQQQSQQPPKPFAGGQNDLFSNVWE